jgi:hypothetical protein
MADHLKQTLHELGELSLVHRRVAVGFSGGKDSLATLDLATKFFKEVVPYYFYFVPGLKSEEAKIKVAQELYKLKVFMYPSGHGIDALRDGLFCDPAPELEQLWLTRSALFNWIKADTGATLFLTGEKRSDGPFRRRRLGAQKRAKDSPLPPMYYPLEHWVKWEVLSYCRANDLPIPDPGRGDNGSVSLLDSEILHAYDHKRDDYERLEQFFPYVRTVVLRREWFPE